MNTTIIIPIHEFNEDIGNYLDKSIDSITKQINIKTLPKLIIVHAKNISIEIKELCEKYKDTELHILLIKNDGKTDYQSQVNLAVDSVDTEYFSVLEFDDEYSTTFFHNVDKHIKSFPDIDIFLNMMIEVNDKNEGIKLTNEMVWAQQFVGENGEMGYLNSKSLKQYTDFKLSGAVIRKSEFIGIGKYKTNIKLTFMYEFLLRALNNTSIIYTIPKIGYKHLVNRVGSLFDGYSKTMPIHERKFWFETAINESNFTTDRVIDTTNLDKNLRTEK